MDISLDREKLISLASSLAKDIKTQADLNALSIELVKLTVETELNAELTEQLGYGKRGANKNARGNSRNGNTPKRLKGTHVEVGILTPHDRDASFEPQRVRKHQTRPGAGANHPLAIASARSDLPPIVYLDCIVIKIRDKLRVINKAIYLALCVNMDGKKELLGLNILRPASSCASFTCYVITSNTSLGKTTRQSQST